MRAITLISRFLLLSFITVPGFAFDIQMSAPPDFADRVNSTNKVGLDFIREVIKDDSGQSKVLKNTMISPISAYTAFAMLHTGLRSQTESKLESFLAAPSHSLTEFDNQNQALLGSLRINKVPDDKQPKFGPKFPVIGIANSAWATNGKTTKARFEFAPEFTSSLEKYYDTAFYSLDFEKSQSADLINKWASEKTNGLIPSVVKPDLIKGLTWLLMNATYLEASWAIKFKVVPAAGAPRFSLLNGQKEAVDMISGGGDLTYIENANYQAVEVPFFGADLSFLVVMPDSNQNFKKWTLDGTFFSQDSWNKLTKAFSDADSLPHESDVRLKLPKFSFAYSKTIMKNQPITKQLGLDFLFLKENKPDFAPLGGVVGTEPGTVVGIVKQDTKIELDENGVKAAAVTLIGPGKGAKPHPKPIKNIVIDRPFVFAIVSKSTGTLLFIGTVVDPKR